MQIHNLYSNVRLAAVIITILAILLHWYMPPKIITLVPNSAYTPTLFHQSNNGGVAQWVNQPANHWTCFNQTGNTSSCGWSIWFTNELSEGVDYSRIKAIRLHLDYKGEASRVRLYLRNYQPIPALKYQDPYRVTNFMSVVVRTKDLAQPVDVGLREFSVAEWWLVDTDAPREFSRPIFDNIVSMGIDYTNPGHHEMTVNAIELHSEYISKELLYLCILGFWLLWLLLESINRFYFLRKKSRSDSRVITDLVKTYSDMEQKKRLFETMSITDALTGVMNRAGLENFINTLRDTSGEPVGLILIDVDYFKKINDTHGHDVGDEVLVSLAGLISRSIRETDVFGRWGGEEFLMLCVGFEEPELLVLAEKLRTLIKDANLVDEKPGLKVTISLGLTFTDAEENFSSAYRRLDAALYQSKANGRNTYTYLKK